MQLGVKFPLLLSKLRHALLWRARHAPRMRATHVLLLTMVAWLLQAGGRAAAVPTPPTPTTSPTPSTSTTPPTPTTPSTPTTPTTPSTSTTHPTLTTPPGLTPGHHGSSPELNTLVGKLGPVKDTVESVRVNRDGYSRQDFNDGSSRKGKMEQFVSNLKKGKVSHTDNNGLNMLGDKKGMHLGLKKVINLFKHNSTNAKQKRQANLDNIQNGEITDVDKRPWTVHIWTTELLTTMVIDGMVCQLPVHLGSAITHTCTGSLIGDQYVLLAAHCVDNSALNATEKMYQAPSKIRIFVGRDSVDDTTTGGIDVTLEEHVNLFFHDSYKRFLEAPKDKVYKCITDNAIGYIPDIAIIKLNRSALDEPGVGKVAVIPLPKGKELDNDYFYGRKCVATGAGFTELFESGTLYDAPMELKDPSTTWTEFERLIETLKKDKQAFKDLNVPVGDEEKYLKESITECAKKQFMYAPGADEPKIFSGDSGGPLACPGEDGGFVLAGVAYGIFQDADKDADAAEQLASPTVGTVHYRTAPYVPWIRSVLGVVDQDDGGGRDAAPRDCAGTAHVMAGCLTIMNVLGKWD